MPTNRVTMRQIRETLRLHLQAGLSYCEVGRVLRISKSVVGKYVTLARVAGVDWELAQTLSDDELEARVYRPAVPRASWLARSSPTSLGRSTPRTTTTFSSLAQWFHSTKRATVVWLGQPPNSMHPASQSFNRAKTWRVSTSS